MADFLLRSLPLVHGLGSADATQGEARHRRQLQSRPDVRSNCQLVSKRDIWWYITVLLRPV